VESATVTALTETAARLAVKTAATQIVAEDFADDDAFSIIAALNKANEESEGFGIVAAEGGSVGGR
jgi:hypothetical protein